MTIEEFYLFASWLYYLENEVLRSAREHVEKPDMDTLSRLRWAVQSAEKKCPTDQPAS